MSETPEGVPAAYLAGLDLEAIEETSHAGDVNEALASGAVLLAVRENPGYRQPVPEPGVGVDNSPFVYCIARPRPDGPV